MPPHFSNPPGYVPVARQVQMLRGAPVDQHAGVRDKATVDKAIEPASCSPARRIRSIARSSSSIDHVGGFGHLLIMGQAGFLEHDETVHGIRTFAREVYPRLKQEFPDIAASGVRDRVVA